MRSTSAAPSILLSALALLPLIAATGHAADIQVTTNADGLADDGECGLREAVVAANTDAAAFGCPAGAGTDTILLQGATYVLSTTGAGEQLAATGDLDVHTHMIVVGQGKGLTTIDGNATDRIFDVHGGEGTRAGELHLMGLTLTNGRVVEVLEDESEADGGAIRILAGEEGVIEFSAPLEPSDVVIITCGFGPFSPHGCAELAEVEVLASAAPEGRGGGIANHGELVLGEALTLVLATGPALAPAVGPTGRESVLVQGNSALGGGGIYNFGRALIFETTVDDNTADEGGGIFNEIDFEPDVTSLPLGATAPTLSTRQVLVFGNLTMAASTVSGNDGVGGGIFNLGTVGLTNVTVSGNSSPGDGGGIFNGGEAVDREPRVEATFSTIAANQATSGGGIWAGGTGGASVILWNSIVADNGGGDCFEQTAGEIGSAGGNIDSDGSCGLANTGDKPGVDPLLAPLGDYGGRTMTHLPLPGSPAIDMALPNAVATASSPEPTLAPRDVVVECMLDEDQRGEPRPQDGDGDGSAHCDIGSVEVAALRISVLEIPTLGAAGLGALALLLALGAVAALRRSAAR